MNNHILDANKSYSLLGRVESAEKTFLSGRRNREEDLESAVTIFLAFLRGFESFTLDQKCITVLRGGNDGNVAFLPDSDVKAKKTSEAIINKSTI